MTRQHALALARILHGDLGMISAEGFPLCMVWQIGTPNTTRGMGRTWLEALILSALRTNNLPFLRDLTGPLREDNNA